MGPDEVNLWTGTSRELGRVGLSLDVAVGDMNADCVIVLLMV